MKGGSSIPMFHAPRKGSPCRGGRADACGPGPRPCGSRSAEHRPRAGRPTGRHRADRRCPRRPAMRPISAAGLTSPPCVETCVIAIRFVRGPIARSGARSSACCRRRCDASTPSIRGRRASANIVYIDGSRFLVGAESEDHPPISHPPPIGPLVTAAQHCDIARERIFLHFEKHPIHPPTLSGRNSTTRSFRPIA
jgi:hypothetical protein